MVQLHLDVQRQLHQFGDLPHAGPLQSAVRLQLLPEQLPHVLGELHRDLVFPEEPAEHHLLRVALGVQVHQLRQGGSHFPEEGGEGDEGDQHHEASEQALVKGHRRQVCRRRSKLGHCPMKGRHIPVPRRDVEVFQPGCARGVLAVGGAERVERASNEMIEDEDAKHEAEHAEDHKTHLRAEAVADEGRHLHQAPHPEQPQQPQRPQHPRPTRILHHLVLQVQRLEDNRDEVDGEDGYIDREPAFEVVLRNGAGAQLRHAVPIEAAREVDQQVQRPERQSDNVDRAESAMHGDERRQLQWQRDDVEAQH
mmetsp:Transcript_30668/g.88951  ORF Transcript_30668/g.88951 Transcript_30668/m.88951 type:complete len:309 (-) Transcript_30668:785-1711(-)